MLFALGMAVVTLFGAKPFPRTPGEPEKIEQVVLKTEKTSEAEEADAILLEKAEPEAVAAKHPIEDLDLGTRTNNALKSAGVNTVEDALAHLAQGDDALLAIDGFGKKSLIDLKQALQEKGYQA
jgi:DNA-directed RNA polymerase alpha subunit